MDEAPAHIAPVLGFTLAYDQDISKQTQSAERSPKPNRLLRRVLDQQLDHKKVQVTPRAGVTPRV